MKRKILVLFFILQGIVLYADEGMWLLSRLKQNNEARMKQLGLEIPVEDIVNHLSQAIISFNGNGTASFVSKDGLVVTNYHCAYAGIQQSSSDEHNYIRDGFWAKTREQEIPLNGVRLTINRAIEDVSDEVNARMAQTKPDRNVRITLMNEMAAGYKKKYPGMQISIRSYRNNTLHVLYAMQAFEDVRLVGAPPHAIAKFGGETDNWTWPRHGCDFAYLRVYVSKDGKSVAYHPDNVAYHPQEYLKVSAEGYKQGDYAMSIGYPGFTDRNATSMQIWEKQQVQNPPMIRVRTARQEILQKFMAEDESLRIKYAEKFASSANYCKNSIGMNQWIEDLHICKKKAEYEQAFLNSCPNDSVRRYYANALRDIEKGIKAAAPYRSAIEYYVETFGEGCEMLRFVSAFGKSLAGVQKDKGEFRKNFITNTNIYYKDYSEVVDRAVTKALLRVMQDDLPAEMLPEFFKTLKTEYNGDMDRFVDELYQQSVFANSDRILAAINDPRMDVTKDKAFVLAKQIEEKQRELFRLSDTKREIAQKGIIEYGRGILNFNQQDYYPDADKSIRLSYGTVCDLPLQNGEVKPFQTSLSGVMAKERQDSPDFRLPERLKSLWKNKDMGSYGINGDVPVDFIMNGDVTGGNSGSPLLNARGELIGLVFDCNWESMTRDFNFDQDLHRVICLDVRYMLFITEKYANMKNIINELLENED